MSLQNSSGKSKARLISTKKSIRRPIKSSGVSGTKSIGTSDSPSSQQGIMLTSNFPTIYEFVPTIEIIDGLSIKYDTPSSL